ncbi:MAG: WecB/TagA/CpsF family glycosyltransferase [Candidatus Magasanikbacteria bacterium]|jgi:N-acetylglucosaminyldiphosphoundecaprenol N-acetyl-beta-D-mannosaminyltransferase|nr:WecB/TagA/CpsF family glycosyltransferase [Candidatus Magasanikbacteria bacterium]MBT4071738.1 WecB/TagA/CpsF family glycosyltransferase [Candidatus Magasanikbacteria bacterium]
MYCLGIRINSYKKETVIEHIRGLLRDNEQHTIFTPNPEMLVDAKKDAYFTEVLNSSDLNICDGFGIRLVSKFHIERITGVDLMQDICNVAAEEGKTVYLLGSGDEDVLKKVKEKLEKKKVNIAGMHAGVKITTRDDGSIDYDEEEHDAMIDDIIVCAPDILFVAFGHGKQEKWIYEQLPHLPSVKLAMGVGGTFDFIAGKAKRAPKLLRVLGLEWAWRLLLEPSRFKRIWKATVVFLFLVLKNR